MARAGIESVERLEELLSEPTEGAVKSLARVDGDLIVLGVGGKMGPTLARMARRASDAAGMRRRVIGVSRFSSPRAEQQLQAHGVETIRCDLLDQHQLDRLPEVPNVVYMTGMKFGSTGQEGLTWAMNAYLPGMVSRKFRNSKIVAFSTGNVYGLTPVAAGGARESDPLAAAGDYAMSCVGRERIFDHFSRMLDISLAILRLNYATEMRYGVLGDIGRRVRSGQPVELAVGYLNAIWQADANAMALAAFDHVASPPFVVNIAGAELLSVRDVALQFARLFGTAATFAGIEGPDAFISDGGLGRRLFGPPRVSAKQMIEWIAEWLEHGGETLGKPTHYETRDGRY